MYALSEKQNTQRTHNTTFVVAGLSASIAKAAHTPTNIIKKIISIFLKMAAPSTAISELTEKFRFAFLCRQI